MASVVEALQALAAVPVETLGDRALAEAARELLAAQNLTDALLARVLAEAAARKLGPGDDPDSGRPQAWLQEQAPALLGSRATTGLLTRARGLDRVPQVSALHAANGVSTAFLDAVIRGTRALDEDVREFADRVLASATGRLIDPADVAKFCEQLLAASRPDQKDRQARDRKSELRISAYGSDGSYAVNGTLHGLPGEFVQQLLLRHARPADTEDRLSSSSAERMARALFDVCRIACRAEDDPEHLAPDHGGEAHLVILATEAAVGGQVGAPAAVTAGGQTLDPGQLAAVVCQARAGRIGTDVILGSIADTGRGVGSDAPDADVELTRQLFAGLLPWPLAARFQPLAFGRSRRLANNPQWHALIARDGHCVVPGCSRHAYWCQAHHLREWQDDHGRTDLENLGLVCTEHHAWLHRAHQHLHPPWCTCHDCERDLLDGRPDAGRWTVRAEPPEFSAPPEGLPLRELVAAH